MAKRIQTPAERVAAMEAENKRRLAAEKKAKEKAAAKVDTAARKEAEALMKKPLSKQEREELAHLDAQANQGRFQPDPTEMLKLGKLRQRAKLTEAEK